MAEYIVGVLGNLHGVSLFTGGIGLMGALSGVFWASVPEGSDDRYLLARATALVSAVIFCVSLVVFAVTPDRDMQKALLDKLQYAEGATK